MCNRTRDEAAKASRVVLSGVARSAAVRKEARSAAVHKEVRSVAALARSSLPADSLVADFRAGDSRVPADLVQAVRVPRAEAAVLLSKDRGAVAAVVVSRTDIAS